MLEFSIILPTYNEAGNIEPLILQLQEELESRDFEIIVVDDNSPDGTSGIVLRLTANNPNLRLITRMENPGLVLSIKEGIDAAASDICLWMDADMSMHASDVRRLLDEIENGADLVLGSRYIEGGSFKGSGQHGSKKGLLSAKRNLKETEDSFLGVVISKYGNFAVRYLLDRKFYDYTSGFYAVRKHVFRDVELNGYYLDYCISFLHRANMNGYVISEVPVVVTPRLRGDSKTTYSLKSLVPVLFHCLTTVVCLLFYRKRKSS